MEEKQKDSIIKELREELENNKQLIFEQKRKIQTFEALEKEYHEEIERLNSDKESFLEKLKNSTEQVVEEKSLMRKIYNEELQCLQKNLIEKDSEIQVLKKDIEELNKRRQSFSINKDDSVLNADELQDEITEMKTIIETLNNKLLVSQAQHSNLEEMQQSLKEEYGNLQNNFDMKREELQKANELIQVLQDDYMCLQIEFKSLKNKPLDEQSRGNSLFAEVNDNRIQLKNKLKSMAVKYNEMERDKESYLKEISSLRNEKTRLLQLFESDIRQYQPGNKTEIDAYKSTIDGLQKLTENYKQEIENINKTECSSASKDLQYYETALALKKKELQSLRDSLDVHSTGHIMQARNLSQLGTEMVNWKWKATQFENEIHILKRRIEELEGQYDKEKQKSTEKESNLDKIVPAKENKSKKINVSLDYRSVLKEIAVNKAITTNNLEPQISEKDQSKICKSEDTSINPNSSKESVIDLTQEEEVKPRKLVHFSHDVKQSENSTFNRKVQKVKPLHFSHYASNNNS